MRRTLLILIVPLSLATQACTALRDRVVDLFDWTGRRVPDVLGKWTFTQPPELDTFNDLRRLDLLAGGMPAQATPTQQATRAQADQRPWLQRFLLPRNTIAFA